MKSTNIMIFGDSIVYGESDKQKGGWVNRLRLSLEKNNDTYYQVFNLGIPGDTTNGLINRFENECEVRYDKEASNIIIFEIGINDTISNNNESTSIKTFNSNIIRLIENAKKYSDNILFIGLTPIDEPKVTPVSWDKDIFYINNRVLQYDDILEKTCLKNKVNYLKVYDLLKIGDLSDGLHPNEYGYEKLYQKVKEKIIKY